MGMLIKIPDVNGLVTAAVLKTKIAEVVNQISNTNTNIREVENKLPAVSDKKVVNIDIIHEICGTKSADFAIENSLCGDVKLTRNADPHKFKYSDYDTVFDTCGRFSISVGSGCGKNVIIFGAAMSSFVPVDNKKKDCDSIILRFNRYSINFTGQQKKL